MTAPTRQQAYSAAVSSIPGGPSRATRWPGRTPPAYKPAASRRTRASSSAKETAEDLPRPSSTTARLGSEARSVSAPQGFRMSLGTGPRLGRLLLADPPGNPFGDPLPHLLGRLRNVLGD